MKTVLCYGDSLTWGMNAATLKRHAYEDLWPSVVEMQLGGAVRMINASLGGRSTSFDDHSVVADRNGVRVLPTILGTFDPIDLVVFMLGTNDMKTWINGSAVAAAQGMKRLVEIVRTYPYEGAAPAPRILIVSPPPATELVPFGAFPLLSPLLLTAISATMEALRGGFPGTPLRVLIAYDGAATCAAYLLAGVAWEE